MTTTSGEISALAVDESAVYWTASDRVWKFEGGVAEALGDATDVTGMAVIGGKVYFSSGSDLAILGASGHLLVTRDDHQVRLYDPRFGAPDFDPRRDTYPISPTECAAVARGAIAIGGTDGARTIEVDGGQTRSYELSGRGATAVRPIDGGLAVIDDAGDVLIARDQGFDQVGGRGPWTMLVDYGGVWATDGRTVLRGADGETLDMTDEVTAMTSGPDGVYVGAGSAIYRVE